MLKQTITSYFDKYDNNRIIDVPRIEFKLKRNPFEYLRPQRIAYRDFRQDLLKQQQKGQQSTKEKQEQITVTDTDKKQSIEDLVKRQIQQFQPRKSYMKRITVHTLQYTTLYSLIVFGFYSRQHQGWKRFQHVLKETLKTALYTGCFFGVNEIIFPVAFKIKHQLQEKPWFSISNVLSMVCVWPLVLLIEWNFFVSLRKIAFTCAYAQFRDFLVENQRFYRLNPQHLSSLQKLQSQRLKHPFEDPSKRLNQSHSRAKDQRDRQQKAQIQRQLLQPTGGQKIPSTHKYFIMPQIYRKPTEQETRIHQAKASVKAQQLLDQRGTTWMRMETKQELQQKARLKQENKDKKKSSWLPW